jgi:hypothetical protein
MKTRGVMGIITIKYNKKERYAPFPFRILDSFYFFPT